jgi:hypothetical protein
MKRIVFFLLAVVLVFSLGSGFVWSADQPDKEDAASCVAPAKGPLIASASDSSQPQGQTSVVKPMTQVTAKVGKSAPDFEASAFFNGKFKNIKLSDYKGRWVLLCFYPGDFTFV